MKKKTLTNDKRNKYFKNWLKKILPFQNPVLCLFAGQIKQLYHRALEVEEMSNWIGPIVKQI